MADEDDEKRKEPRNPNQKLPTVFEVKREELYQYHTQVNMAILPIDRDNFLMGYLDRMDYIITRILPNLRPRESEQASKIQAYAREYISKYKLNPTAGLPELNANHKALAEILHRYDFSKLVLKDFNAF